MGPSRIDQALTAIDDLIAKLQNGQLVSKAASRPTENGRSSLVIQSAVQPKKVQPKKPPPTANSNQSDKVVDAAGAGRGGQGDGFTKAWIAVGRVISAIPHPNSEKLYITKVDIGNDQVRQIVAGLQKYVEAAQLEGSLVLVVLNLKPAKLAGELSEGMILAATAPPDTVSAQQESVPKVAPLAPSPGAEPGELAFTQDLGTPPPMSSFPKAMKGEHWRKISSLLTVMHGVACYNSVPLVTTSGPVQAPGFPDASTIS